ncbi:hypothetical protein B0H12DRAFT_1138837 [Mycena haematopus]|nr:hypothetical protein B0H12DRAFT_1138837 [Mycena haematopus]
MSARAARSGSFFPCSQTSNVLQSMSFMIQIMARWLRHLIPSPTLSLMCAIA